MSSPIPFKRSSSPSDGSSDGASSSFSSISSRSSNQPLVYTRDELLALGTSPLSQLPLPSAVASFPEIKRKTRRGVLEAYQALDYERGSHAQGNAVVNARSSPRGTEQSLSPVHSKHPGSPSPRKHDAKFLTQVPAPVWSVDYIPVARRIDPSELRVRPGRDPRSSARAWRQPRVVSQGRRRRSESLLFQDSSMDVRQ
ncbi:hypothetical protein K439DRAFT_1627030 [Ramaria rubella]|nr:hypothetical protein K439DRAFT_1627030 [Ramaria rubella]